jgi:hypothetical protein
MADEMTVSGYSLCGNNFYHVVFISQETRLMYNCELTWESSFMELQRDTQRERLFYIDFLAFFVGQVARKEHARTW